MKSSYKRKGLTSDSQASQSIPYKENQTKNKDLPEIINANLEHSFGFDFSKVKILRDSKEAEKMNARAYTQAEQIHFAPGEFNPDTDSGRNLIGHEFTHIVQQRSGMVKPTTVMGKNLRFNDNRGLEREADSLGKKASQGEIVTKYRSSSLGIRDNLRTAQAKSNVIQRAVKTWGGTWDTDQYDLKKDEANGTKFPAAAGVRGVDIKLKFAPGNQADAELIGLTQSVQAFVGGSASYTNPTNKAMSIKSKDAKSINTGKGETDEGTAIDRAPSFNNPIYAVATQPSKTLDDPNTHAGWGHHGYRKKNKAGNYITKDATLIDMPRRGGASKDSRHIFETTALAVKGSQNGTYYGSVRWGWRTDSKANFTKIPLQVVSQGVPSSTFMKSAEIWNASKDSTGAKTVDLPTVDVKLTTSTITGIYPSGSIGPPFSLPANTRVQIIRNATASSNGEIKVIDGVFTGNILTVSATDMGTLTDERN